MNPIKRIRNSIVIHLPKMSAEGIEDFFVFHSKVFFEFMLDLVIHNSKRYITPSLEANLSPETYNPAQAN